MPDCSPPAAQVRLPAERDTKRVAGSLKCAGLRQSACIADIDLRTPRGLNRSLLARLVTGEWVARHNNLAITGPIGFGKSCIACALGQKACRDGRSVLYQRVPRMFEALALVRGDGRYVRLMKTYARVDLLILDDWGISTLNQSQRVDLLDILEDGNCRGSTLVTSQLPVDQWHEFIGDPTLADAILDRLVHNAHHLTLTGYSMRRAAGRRALDPNLKS